MFLSEIPLTKEDFERSAYEEIITNCDKKICERYSSKFFEKAKEAQELGNITDQAALTLLGCVTSPRLKSESNDEPFAALWVMNDGSRSPIPTDFSDAHLNIIRDFVPDITDAELRARIADILWIRLHDYRMAQLAVDSYLASASLLEDPEKWTYCVDRIERALRLSRKSNQKQHSSKVIAHIEFVLDKYQGEDKLFLSVKLMELLQEQKQGEPSKYSALAEKAALRAESEHNWHKARDCWGVKVGWHKMEKDSDKEREAGTRLAETYVKEAEDALERETPSYLTASRHLQSAIEAFRRVGGEAAKQQVEVLHKKLIEYQKQSRSELVPISQELDISEFVKKARRYVEGKNIQDALFSLALIAKSPKVSELKARVEENAEKFILQHFFPMVIMNEQGKVVGRQSSVRDEMFREAVYHQQMQAEAVIAPAMYQINLEHNVKISDFYPIVANSAFVPQGREDIYARGLYAGLVGDYLVATHLLIPQIENSLRSILSDRGFITSGLNDDGIQDEHNINTFFREKESELIQIFGEDITFDLQGLLVQKGFGSNLRNLMAHGLKSYNGFFQPQTVYLWWLTLHLCCVPIIISLRQSQTGETKSN
jgi:Domain of unknown function (DUF4209)